MYTSFNALICSGILSLFVVTAIPTTAQPVPQSDNTITVKNSIKNIQADVEQPDLNHTILVAETELENEPDKTARTSVDEPSTRRPLSCRIFPAASMQH